MCSKIAKETNEGGNTSNPLPVFAYTADFIKLADLMLVYCRIISTFVVTS